MMEEMGVCVAAMGRRSEGTRERGTEPRGGRGCDTGGGEAAESTPHTKAVSAEDPVRLEGGERFVAGEELWAEVREGRVTMETRAMLMGSQRVATVREILKTEMGPARQAWYAEEDAP